MNLSAAFANVSGPKPPTKAQLDKLVRARAAMLYARRYNAGVRIDQRMTARYEKALKPVLARLQATALSYANQEALDSQAAAYMSTHMMGPGIDW